MTDLPKTPAEQWRLLDENEPRQLGDELYMAQWSRDVWTPWAPDLNKPISHLLARRRMEDPAEPLRRELREAYGLISRMLKEMLEGGNSPRPHECAEWLARNAAFGGKEGSQ